MTPINPFRPDLQKPSVFAPSEPFLPPPQTGSLTSMLGEGIASKLPGDLIRGFAQVGPHVASSTIQTLAASQAPPAGLYQAGELTQHQRSVLERIPEGDEKRRLYEGFIAQNRAPIRDGGRRL